MVTSNLIYVYKYVDQKDSAAMLAVTKVTKCCTRFLVHTMLRKILGALDSFSRDTEPPEKFLCFL